MIETLAPGGPPVRKLALRDCPSGQAAVAIPLFGNWTGKYGRPIDGGSRVPQIESQGLLRSKAPGTKISACGALPSTEGFMRRVITLVLLSLAASVAASLPARGEEITLKDGTKIVGHLSGITSEKIEVETSYGKVQLNRNDIVTISFPQSGSDAKASDATSANTNLAKIDESLSGTQYVNRTGKFSLTLPADWMIEPSLRRTAATLAAFTSKDKMRFAMVIQEEYPGSLESYKEITMLNARRTLSNFEELANSNVTIDGKTALLVFYRGTLAKTNNLPVEFVSAIIVSGNSYTKITAWCIEPLFHDMQPAFEKLVNSYRGSARLTAADSR